MASAMSDRLRSTIFCITANKPQKNNNYNKNNNGMDIHLVPSSSREKGKTALVVAILFCSLNQLTLFDRTLDFLHVDGSRDGSNLNNVPQRTQRLLRGFNNGCVNTTNHRDSSYEDATTGTDVEDDTPCALLFFGLAKQFRTIVLPSIHKHILTVANNNRQCDIFLHNYNITETSNPRTGEWNETLNPNEVYDLTEHVVIDTLDEFQKSRNMEYYAGPGRKPHGLLGWDQTALENMYKQWHSIERVWDLMQDTEQQRGIHYQRVGLFRSDVRYVTPIDILDGIDAAIPKFGFVVNDRLFYGTYDNAHIWAKSRFPSVPSYVPRHEKIRMHSEFFLKDWILPQIPNVTIMSNICFHRVRANGEIWDDDCDRQYRFPQFLVDANLAY